MLRLFFASLLSIASLAPFAPAAISGERVVVVELYTSQGCSSCPPADALLGELAQREDVIALAFHVDYWDYIGWVDEFGNPDHTRRQKGYAHAAGQRTIYTPQMIVGGRDHVVGYKPMQLGKYIQIHQDFPEGVQVALTRASDRVEIAVQPVEGTPAAEILLLRYRPSAEVAIRRGENAGRTLSYHNIVTSMERLDVWDGAGEWRRSVALEGDEPVVVLVQAEDYGPILSAARLR
jgi:hypothetical protein